MLYKYIDGLPFTPVTFPANRPDGLYVENLQLDFLVSYIQRKGIQKAFLNAMTDFSFLDNCHSLRHLTIRLNTPFSQKNLERATSLKTLWIHHYPGRDLREDFGFFRAWKTGKP